MEIKNITVGMEISEGMLGGTNIQFDIEDVLNTLSEDKLVELFFGLVNKNKILKHFYTDDLLANLTDSNIKREYYDRGFKPDLDEVDKEDLLEALYDHDWSPQELCVVIYGWDESKIDDLLEELNVERNYLTRDDLITIMSLVDKTDMNSVEKLTLLNKLSELQRMAKNV